MNLKEKMSAAIAKMRENKFFGPIVVAVVAVIVVILAILLFSGRSEKATVRKYVKAYFTGNEKSMARLIHRKELKVMLEDADLDKDELDELFDFEDLMEEFEGYYGDKWKYSYEIETIVSYHGETLEEGKDEYDDEYEMKISAAKMYRILVEVEGEDEDDEEWLTISLVKVGGSWYVSDY